MIASIATVKTPATLIIGRMANLSPVPLITQSASRAPHCEQRSGVAHRVTGVSATCCSANPTLTATVR